MRTLIERCVLSSGLVACLAAASCAGIETEIDDEGSDIAEDLHDGCSEVEPGLWQCADPEEVAADESAKAGAEPKAWQYVWDPGGCFTCASMREAAVGFCPIGYTIIRHDCVRCQRPSYDRIRFNCGIWTADGQAGAEP
jgi:hypothetical protein